MSQLCRVLDVRMQRIDRPAPLIIAELVDLVPDLDIWDEFLDQAYKAGGSKLRRHLHRGGLLFLQEALAACIYSSPIPHHRIKGNTEADHLIGAAPLRPLINAWPHHFTSRFLARSDITVIPDFHGTISVGDGHLSLASNDSSPPTGGHRRSPRIRSAPSAHPQRGLLRGQDNLLGDIPVLRS